jgi:DNA repair and recombination protein RAD52
MFTEEQVKSLTEKLDPKRIKSRSQAGRSLSYIETWDAIETANRIFGFDGWGCNTVELRYLGTVEHKGSSKVGWKVAYLAIVRVRIGDAPEVEGSGFGVDISYNSELDAHELALKEAESDALKRALKKYGNQFGLCLYDKLQEGVDNPPPASKPAAPKPGPAPTPELVTEALLAAAEPGETPAPKHKFTPATDEELQDLYVALKTAGKSPEDISKIIQDNAAANGGANPSVWVQRQLGLLFFKNEKEGKS